MPRAWVYSTTGNDTTGDGTVGNPYATPGKAVSMHSPEDQIVGRGGTYTANQLDLLSGTSDSAYTEFTSYTGETATIQASADGNGIIYLPTARDYLYIYNVVLDSLTKANSGINIKSTKGVNRSRYHKVVNVEITGGLHGVIGSPSYSLFQDMNIHDGGVSNLDHCFYINGDALDNVIDSCLLNNWVGFGVTLYSGSAGDKPSGTEVKNCLVHDVDTGLSVDSAGTNNTFHHNYIWACTRTGAKIHAGTYNKIYNNALYANRTGSSGGQLQCDGGGATNELRNNISLASVSGNNYDNSGGATASNNVTSGTATDYWTDPASADFSLLNNATTQANVIGRGVAVGIAFDYYGTGIPQGAAPDIGPEEFGATAPPDAPLISHASPYAVVPNVYTGSVITLSDGDNNTVKVAMVGVNMTIITTPTANVTVTAP